MRGGVMHYGMKVNRGRMRLERNFPYVCKACRLVGRPAQLNSAPLSLFEHSELISTVIQSSRFEHPVLFIFAAFRHGPDLVAAVVDPFARGLVGRYVFAFIFGIHEEVGMAFKFDLHQASAQLRNDGQPDPSIGDLLSLPAPEINWLNCAALRMNRHSESCQ